jgi:hypothetical protein
MDLSLVKVELQKLHHLKLETSWIEGGKENLL